MPPVIIIDRRDGFGDDVTDEGESGKECRPGTAEGEDEINGSISRLVS